MESKTFWNLLFLCCILSSPTILTANNPADLAITANPIKICGQRHQLNSSNNGNCPAGSITAEFNTGCRDGYVPLSAYTANLVKGPIRGKTYSWPSKYPDLHLRWEYDTGVFVISPKLDSWTYSGDNVHGHPIFECPLDVIPFILAGSYECPDITIPEIHNMEVSIVTPGDADFVLYPIHEYNGANEIFSCEVFTETCAACSLPVSGYCTVPLDPIYDINVCLDCSQCALNHSPTNHGDKAATSLTVPAASMQVQPNPFNGQTNLMYSTNLDAPVQISIYNANGSQVGTQNQMSFAGKNTFDLNMEHLPNGIYYIEVADGININLQRVVKMQ